ncbi:MAG: hypothetical protein D6732_07030 [Methanobacteriota archaeon]|nr:MAG: hypothetical protein D6732_07030 [Euryarchaeota archaeon]
MTINLDYLVNEIHNYILDLRLSPEQTDMAISYVLTQLENKRNASASKEAFKPNHLEEFAFTDC